MKTTRFNAARYLDNEERQVAYISAALETGDAEFIRDALGLIARARGIAKVARSADLNRESLYRALGENGNPEFATVIRVVRALGLTLSARPTAKRGSKKRRAPTTRGRAGAHAGPTGASGVGHSRKPLKTIAPGV
jgi:probable addiction module antidote protein